MSNKSLTVGLIAVAIIAVAGWFFPLVQASLGSSGTRFPNGISADSTSPSAGQVRGTTLTTTGASTFGGTVTVTTTNAATSTVASGCYQFTATSTASPMKIVPATYATTTSTSGYGTAGFPLVAVFGTCP